MIKIAHVNIWNKRVGTVMWSLHTNTATFEYDNNFLMQGLNLSPIKMPIGKGKYFSFPELKNISTFKGLPGLLADSLPDAFGNGMIKAWLSSQGRTENNLNPVERLCFIASRGMGALEFEPANPKSNNTSSKIEINSLIKVANDILSGRKNFRAKISDSDENAMLEIMKIGTSPGGARPKAIIAFNPNTREVRSGQADAPEGFSHWIIKFDGTESADRKIDMGHGKMEFAYYKMAIDAGIEMSECMLLEENGRSHFMTKRFDREGNKKIHMQSLSALRHFDTDRTNSYEDLFETMRLLHLPHPQTEQMYRRMVFNVIAMNYDDHTKNFAFLMDESGQWKLSPAFDLAYSYKENFQGRLRSSYINGKKSNITRSDLLQVAKRLDIKKADRIIDEVSGVVIKWYQYAENAGVNEKLLEIINSNLLIL